MTINIEIVVLIVGLVAAAFGYLLNRTLNTLTKSVEALEKKQNEDKKYIESQIDNLWKKQSDVKREIESRIEKYTDKYDGLTKDINKEIKDISREISDINVSVAPIRVHHDERERERQ